MTRETPETLKTEQHGGRHYKDMAIQPAEYAQRNGLKFCEAEAIKYLSRHQHKGGAVDVRKAIHFCKMVLEFEYGETYESVEPNPESDAEARERAEWLVGKHAVHKTLDELDVPKFENSKCRIRHRVVWLAREYQIWRDEMARVKRGELTDEEIKALEGCNDRALADIGVLNDPTCECGHKLSQHRSGLACMSQEVWRSVPSSEFPYDNEHRMTQCECLTFREAKDKPACPSP